MRVWRMSLQRTKSAIISWDGLHGWMEYLVCCVEHATPVRQYYKSEQWAPCCNQTLSWYDWKIVKSYITSPPSNTHTNAQSYRIFMKSVKKLKKSIEYYFKMLQMHVNASDIFACFSSPINTPVIYNHCPHTYGDGRAIAGLMCGAVTFLSSPTVPGLWYYADILPWSLLL